MKKRRSAYSLVEMLVVMSLLGTLFSLMGAGLVTLYGLDRSARDDLQFSDTLTAFELLLRSDARTATSAAANDEATLVLSAGEQTIRWHFDARELTRVVTRDDHVVARERWPLPNGMEVLFRVADESALECFMVDRVHPATPPLVIRAFTGGEP
jgi:prepilin-type N-terminal cleavage/methylation domain-containing protein